MSDEPGRAHPDPWSEMRMTTLHATRGINYWSRRPVTRMDVVVGAYDEISSADVPGVTERLVDAMPGLREHYCSIGERGGFLVRLRRGTYAPHIVEHVALELQTMIGHDVGYGRTRGGDEPGEYTLVFEYVHEQVGVRAAALALEIVQRAFAVTLEPTHVRAAVSELSALAATPQPPPLRQHVWCGITGSDGRGDCQELLRADDGGAEQLVIDLSPGFLLQAGLPYSRSDLAVVLDTAITDVPERYRDPARARRLLGIVADAVRRGGFLICPASEWEIQDHARDEGCRVAVFATGQEVTSRDLRCASAVGLARGGEIWLERAGQSESGGRLRQGISAAAQVAAALARFISREADAVAEPERGAVAEKASTTLALASKTGSDRATQG